MNAALDPATGNEARGFRAALDQIRAVEGWLTADQAQRLWVAARHVRAPGLIVEIGSFRGRSTIILASARPEGVELVAIDPHAGGDRRPQDVRTGPEEGQRDFEAFQANLRQAGVADRVRHVRARSVAALDLIEGTVDLLYVDGAHRYRPARADIERWGARLPPGGTMLVHDSFSAIGVLLAQLRVLTFAGHWRYCGRCGSLAEYRREQLALGARIVGAVRQLAQLPYFVRNQLVKLALVARLEPVAALLGHREGDWPH